VYGEGNQLLADGLEKMSYIRLDISIHEVGADAAGTLADIHAICFRHSWSAESFKSFLENKVHRAVVASVSGPVNEPVGFVLIRSIAGEAEILSIAVAPQHRETGIASGLLYKISALMKEEKVKKIFLEVGQQNGAALRLYERAGFKPVGGRKAYYRSASDEPPGDAIIMEKIL